MNGINKKQFLIKASLLFLFSCFALSATAAQKTVGKTLLTKGSVIGKRSTGNIKLKRRSLIFEKDEIHVGKNARAQFRMNDRALISLQENSVLKIKNYQQAKSGKKSSVLLELLAGGLRTITGAIGKGNKKAYELRTPLATIGVRGTDYEVEIVSNGMYLAVWGGSVQLRSRLSQGCNMLVGRSQSFMFVFMNKQGRCKGLQKIPPVFATGHSSNVSSRKSVNAKQKLSAGAKRSKLLGRRLDFEPMLQEAPSKALSIKATTYDFDGFNVDQSQPSTEIASESSAIDSSTPIFKVGLDLFKVKEGGGTLNFQQSIGDLPVSWGYWESFSKTQALINDSSIISNQKGMIWTSYQKTDPNVVVARTGTFFRYEAITDSLLKSSAGSVKNLQVQMDVNFESGNVTNGALSANTSSETWVAVFDGEITSGDLDLQMNGASVVNSDPATSSSPRDASGFITGDFVGDSAKAIVGGFGLSEDKNTSNHIEGTFIVK